MLRTRLSGLGLLTVGAVAAGALTSGGLGFSSETTPVGTMPARAGDCYREGATLTVEEQRVSPDVTLPGSGTGAAEEFIQAGGFESTLARFERRLCTLNRLGSASAVIETFGAQLWQTAVERAQGRVTQGDIDAYDDRPLYWTRTAMKRALREWQPSFPLTSLQRQSMIRQLDYASRGIGQVSFPQDEDVTTMLISGFDTYSLDSSLRNSNPSGASALQLDGRRFETEAGTVEVQAVVLPVNWTDFDQGVVEDAFGPWLVAEDHPDHLGSVDAIMTISQTGRGRMDVEKWAGGFRGGSPDNNRSINFGPVSAAALWPQPQPSPQFIETTLPFQAMIDAGTGPWPGGAEPRHHRVAGGHVPRPGRAPVGA